MWDKEEVRQFLGIMVPPSLRILREINLLQPNRKDVAPDNNWLV